MEENNNDITVSMPWSEIISLGLLGAMIVAHASNANPLLFGFIMIYLVVKSGMMFVGQIVVWRQSMAFAQGVLMNDPLAICGVYALNPITWPALVLLVTTGAATVYVWQVDPTMWALSLFAITPHIFRYFVYNRILKFIGNSAVQKFANEENKFIEEEQQRSLILQEELNKVMPEVLDAARERWKEAGIYMEEMDEHNQPVEPDHETESTTDKDD